MSKRQGFTLIELSIVLVIVGLLIGAVLTGKSLIRAAGIHSITSRANNYLTAIAVFKGAYLALPGDLKSATNVWGTSSACGGASSTGTCNGDGNEQIDPGIVRGGTSESFQLWRHMALAGMIPGDYSGLDAGGGCTSPGQDTILGQNAPSSRIANVGYGIRWLDATLVPSYVWNKFYGNVFIIGAQNRCVLPEFPAFTPDEAWSIDTKQDDGMPATGRIVMQRQSNSRYANCTTTDVPATTTYNLTYSGVACAVIWMVGL